MIGEVIYKKRRELGYTQAELADILQVTAPAVNKWEKNLSYPDVTLLSPLARCLKIDLNELFSFYNYLTEKERKMISKKISKLLTELKDEEAFDYIDEVVHQNLADGLLYKEIANALYGMHVIRKIVQPEIFLNESAYYYEKSLELSTENPIATTYTLINIYGEMGNKDRAMELWESLPENTPDKEYVYIEMLYTLHEHSKAAEELKKYLLKSTINLICDFESLKENLTLSEQFKEAEMVETVSNKLMDLFDINPLIKMFNNLSDSYANNDLDAQIEHLRAIFDFKKHNDLSGIELFRGVSLESCNSEARSKAEVLSDFNNWIADKK